MINLKVTGMDCQHCVASVTEAIAEVPGAGRVLVDLASGKVSIEGAPDRAALRTVIEGVGYGVE